VCPALRLDGEALVAPSDEPVHSRLPVTPKRWIRYELHHLQWYSMGRSEAVAARAVVELGGGREGGASVRVCRRATCPPISPICAAFGGAPRRDDDVAMTTPSE